jgi:hypothetical protein
MKVSGLGTCKARGLTNCAHKHIKRPALDICRAPEVDELDVAFAIQYHILILDVTMHDLGLCVQVMDGLGDLNKDLSTLLLFHVHPELDVVEKIHPG